MAIFGSKKNKDSVKDSANETKVKDVAKSVTALPAGVSGDAFILMIKNPRITEKATLLSEKNQVYTFDVDSRATKNEIKKVVQKLYGVVPIKVNIVRGAEKNVSYRGKSGRKSAGKKAYVYLKKGDKIEFV